jgi:hypothetical protein
MKTRLIIIIFICGVLTSATNAQFIRGYGLKIGAVSATQTWDYKTNTKFPADRRWGVDAGGYIEVLNIPYISLLGELHYIQKGFSMTLPVTTISQPDGTGEYITLKPRVDYLSVPVLAKLRFDLGKVFPYLLAGPRFDFLISKNPDGFQAVIDNFKNIDFGISLGAGFEVPLKFIKSVLAEFRYSPSFTEAYSGSSLTVKNQSFEILIGIRL